MQRRDLLRGLAFAGTTMATAAGRVARAARGRRLDAEPKLVFIYTPCGREPSWRTGTPGRSFTLGPTMKLFEPHRSKMCILDGFTTVNFGYHLNAHWAAAHCMLGGWPPNRRPGNNGGALDQGSQSTFDHLMAARIGRSSPISNVVLGGLDRDDGQGGSLEVSWLGPGVPQMPIHDHADAFARLFGQAGHRADALSAQQLLQRQKDVLGLAGDEMAALRRQLGRDEQGQLASYEENLLGMLERLSKPPPPRRRPDPSIRIPATLSDLTSGIPSDEEFQHQLDVQSRILAAALACGRTQVAVYVMAGNGSRMVLPGSPQSHHLHDDQAFEHYRAYDVFYGDRVKFLLDELGRYPEGEGTVLDNTLILWTSEISWPPKKHAHDNIPITLFGGLPGGRFRIGQYLQVPSDDGGGDRVKALASKENWRLPDVLLTIAHALGVRDLDGFADPAYSKGLVTELLA